jgi:hypothetical protein
MRINVQRTALLRMIVAVIVMLSASVLQAQNAASGSLEGTVTDSTGAGAVWNARRTMLDVWGTAPTRIEVIKGWLTLKQLDGAVGVLVTALDGSAKPLGETRGRRLEIGWEIAIGDKPATSYLIRIVR